MIDVTHVTKCYGQTTAVDDLTFTVKPGIVTGFLGPNGAGKSTTMRLILGLDAPTSGSATVNGKALTEHRAPMTEIGALLEAKAIHPQRSARNHLHALAATNRISKRRADEVLGMVGLEEVADRTAGGFSLGMGQRLGIASALLGDPETIMLDEPVNGLDPEGIRWIRHLLQELADQGRTVFVSSHLMSEMALMAHHFVIVGRGRLLADVTAAELEAMSDGRRVVVRTPDGAALRRTLAGEGVTITALADTEGGYAVTGLDSDDIGREAARAGLVLLELTPQSDSLETTFMKLTQDSVQYRTHSLDTVPSSREAA